MADSCDDSRVGSSRVMLAPSRAPASSGEVGGGCSMSTRGEAAVAVMVSGEADAVDAAAAAAEGLEGGIVSLVLCSPLDLLLHSPLLLENKGALTRPAEPSQHGSQRRRVLVFSRSKYAGSVGLPQATSTRTVVGCMHLCMQDTKMTHDVPMCLSA